MLNYGQKNQHTGDTVLGVSYCTSERFKFLTDETPVVYPFSVFRSVLARILGGLETDWEGVRFLAAKMGADVGLALALHIITDCANNLPLDWRRTNLTIIFPGTCLQRQSDGKQVFPGLRYDPHAVQENRSQYQPEGRFNLIFLPLEGFVPDAHLLFPEHSEINYVK